jgi:hypothetical protein
VESIEMNLLMAKEVPCIETQPFLIVENFVVFLLVYVQVRRLSRLFGTPLGTNRQKVINAV